MTGIPKNIETPEQLWQYFLAYQKEVKENPKLVQDFVGKDGTEVDRKREKPLTLEGFEDWCFEHEIINDLGDYFSNRQGRYSEFTTICRAIRRRIRKDQIEGGMAGIYNPSITQRLNGLVEKSQTDGNTVITVNYAKLGGNASGATPEPD
jgi:hypothetical protein